MDPQFPTREGFHRGQVKYGTPTKAVPCRCPNPLVEDDSCVRCGRLVAHIIEATFDGQASSTAPRELPGLVSAGLL